jgi:uncharacterized protein (DUF983 family)
MSEWGSAFIQFTNVSPVFKGGMVAVVGLAALLFAMWMRWKWREPLWGGFVVFILLSVFIILYGLFIFIFHPQWWKLPY